MPHPGTCCLLAALLGVTATEAAAQRSPRVAVPLTVSFHAGSGRPAFTVGGALRQAGWGLLGGWGAALVAMAPLAGGSWDSASGPGDEAVAVIVGAAFLAGHTAGIHYGGRRQGMRASPWATAGGVLLGLTLAGATVQADEDGAAQPNLLILVAPAAGGVAGYALTRRHRED